jgi:hypothetical protein
VALETFVWRLLGDRVQTQLLCLRKAHVAELCAGRLRLGDGAV